MRMTMFTEIKSFEQPFERSPRAVESHLPCGDGQIPADECPIAQRLVEHIPYIGAVEELERVLGPARSEDGGHEPVRDVELPDVRFGQDTGRQVGDTLAGKGKQQEQ